MFRGAFAPYILSCVLYLASIGSHVVCAQNQLEREACDAQRHVSIAFDAQLDAELQRETLADLRSELAPRGLRVCLAAESPAGIALAEVRVETRNTQRIAIEVFDRTTDKRVGRDLQLSNVPTNGRALAVAIAIDELLRASWAELALRHARTEAAPPLAKAQVKDPPLPPKTKLSFGIEGTYARSFEHYDAFGAVGVGDLLIRRLLWLEGRAGFSAALKRKVSEGSISVAGPVAALTFGACLPQARRIARMCLGFRTGLEVLRFSGDSDSRAQGQTTLNPVVIGAGVGQVRLRLLRALSLSLGAGAGTALLGARVSNGARTLARIDGLMLQTSIGLGIER